MSNKYFNSNTPVTIVVGGIIGTGVFISLGFQLQEFHSPFVLMLLWVVGGVTSLCGAMTYCELASALRKSGGEYNYLREIFHPSIGFVAGCISALVGFAGPCAVVAMTFGAYMAAAYPWLNQTIAAVMLLLICTGIHVYSHFLSGAFQNGFTYVKVVLLFVLCVVTIYAVDQPQPLNWLPKTSDFGLVLSGGFAVSLIYVNYAYAGWNSSTYIAEELENPGKDINRALIKGTLIVILLYVLLNFIFLYSAPISQLEGAEEVAYIVAAHVFGDMGAMITSVLLAILLVSTLSSMTLAGPRVLARMGGDFASLKWLNFRNKDELPIVAILLQSGLAIAFVLTGEFESIVKFAGLSLAFSSIATVCAAMYRRYKESEPTEYRIPWYPLPPLVFLAITGYAAIYTTWEEPTEGLMAIGLVGGSLLTYLFVRRLEHKQLSTV